MPYMELYKKNHVFRLFSLIVLLMDLVSTLSTSQEFYKSSKRKFDADEAFKKRAQEAVVKLQVIFHRFELSHIS